MIEAAGAVLWRDGDDGGPQLAVIFRRKRDDWTLPKGKLERGEDFLDAALREVAEETGYAAEPGASLGETRYRMTHSGRPEDKVVRYWAMRALDGAFAVNAEVDELRWLTPAAARALLTYDRDREVIDAFLETREGGEPTRDGDAAPRRRQPS